MKSLFYRVLFWLTHDVRCSWCRAVLHKAPLYNGKVSHGICRKCLTELQSNLNYD
jgi:hypothetical protein